jgi:benzaldehyde dehydrogenase (NAD)
VESLIAHPAVRRINFTGSTPVGRIIARTCGEHLKPAVLELGGKAPLLVLDDADLEQAAAGAIFGAFANAGQICMSTERIIVDATVAEAFVAQLARRAAALPASLLGPVVDMKTVTRCNALIEDALAKGRACWPAAYPIRRKCAPPCLMASPGKCASGMKSRSVR